MVWSIVAQHEGEPDQAKDSIFAPATRANVNTKFKIAKQCQHWFMGKNTGQEVDKSIIVLSEHCVRANECKCLTTIANTQVDYQDWQCHLFLSCFYMRLKTGINSRLEPVFSLWHFPRCELVCILLREWAENGILITTAGYHSLHILLHLYLMYDLWECSTKPLQWHWLCPCGIVRFIVSMLM